MKQTLYRSIFWLGYLMVLAATFIPLKQDFLRQPVNLITFKVHLDQIFHAVVYLLICLYFYLGHYMGLTLFRRNSVLVFLVMILVLATVTEGVQIFVPARVFNVFDWIANLIGIGMGMGIYWVTGRRKAVGRRH